MRNYYLTCIIPDVRLICCTTLMSAGNTPTVFYFKAPGTLWGWGMVGNRRCPIPLNQLQLIFTHRLSPTSCAETQLAPGSFYGAPSSSSQRSTSTCPPAVAYSRASEFHGQPCSRAHRSTSRCRTLPLPFTIQLCESPHRICTGLRVDGSSPAPPSLRPPLSLVNWSRAPRVANDRYPPRQTLRRVRDLCVSARPSCVT